MIELILLEEVQYGTISKQTMGLMNINFNPFCHFLCNKSNVTSTKRNDVQVKQVFHLSNVSCNTYYFRTSGVMLTSGHIVFCVGVRRK